MSPKSIALFLTFFLGCVASWFLHGRMSSCKCAFCWSVPDVFSVNHHVVNLRLSFYGFIVMFNNSVFWFFKFESNYNIRLLPCETAQISCYARLHTLLPCMTVTNLPCVNLLLCVTAKLNMLCSRFKEQFVYHHRYWHRVPDLGLCHWVTTLLKY